MAGYIKAFIRASLLWLSLGLLVGLAIAVRPEWAMYRPVHAHLNAAGFLAMLIFGVGYQLLPRLFGHPLLSDRLPVAHFVLANAGLAILVLGFLLRPHLSGAGTALTVFGGVSYASGAYCWVWNLWQTFDAGDRRARPAPVASSRRLPTVDHTEPE
jgi:cbb3-type cytochrome oxidase subunit 1